MSSGSSKGFTLARQRGGVFVRHVGIHQQLIKGVFGALNGNECLPRCKAFRSRGNNQKGRRAWKNVEADKCKK